MILKVGLEYKQIMYKNVQMAQEQVKKVISDQINKLKMHLIKQE
jgi:hypothetical protein